MQPRRSFLAIIKTTRLISKNWPKRRSSMMTYRYNWRVKKASWINTRSYLSKFSASLIFTKMSWKWKRESWSTFSREITNFSWRFINKIKCLRSSRLTELTAPRSWKRLRFSWQKWRRDLRLRFNTFRFRRKVRFKSSRNWIIRRNWSKSFRRTLIKSKERRQSWKTSLTRKPRLSKVSGLFWRI